MAKQLNVNLAFNADVKQAQAQIAQLQKSLDNLMSGSIKDSSLTGFNSQISNAQQSVLKLKSAINNSLNADTGRLDLSKFNTQLNNSGLSISKLASDMSAIGPDGQKAFLNLAKSITTAQKPMIETNKLLDSMWTTLKNTARWQVSSSILHGLVGALQGAYGYAQDLDKSLNNIRIVTGQSTEQMAAFAEQANKSAQALSVSTTAYTDAALIYYQQGLNDAEVKARTDVTMMMSNVTGESAEHVSSYMTAIWNNFAEGSTNLEHFADVITALGAATASSSEEIANGMQQFAAVADTVGLSYEYAASALATVVAQTRQSESTVGNAFRTIFSRLESLKLGKTLEDGVGLTKYTEALQKAGVEVLNQNGELKDMDTILNEIGEKWQQLNRTQRMTLAETVGGVRQYTNLIALFDNWDKFQENLAIAQDSNGSLEKQAEIYEESWEAARKRVKAAWQSIYQDLIDEKFLIGVANGISKIIGLVDHLIDSIGGLPGLLALISSTLMSTFGNKMSESLQHSQDQLKKILKPAEFIDLDDDGNEKVRKNSDGRTYAEIKGQELRRQALKEAQNMGGLENDIAAKNLQTQIELNDKLLGIKKGISKEDFIIYQQLIEQTDQYAKIAAENAKRQVDLKNKRENSYGVLTDRIYLGDVEDEEGALATLDEIQEKAKGFAKYSDEYTRDSLIKRLTNQLVDFRKEIGATEGELKDFISSVVNEEIGDKEKNASEQTSILTEKVLSAKLDIEKARLEGKEDLDAFIEKKVDEVAEISKQDIQNKEKEIQDIQKNIDNAVDKSIKRVADLQKAIQNLSNGKLQGGNQSAVNNWTKQWNEKAEEYYNTGGLKRRQEIEKQLRDLQKAYENAPEGSYAKDVAHSKLNDMYRNLGPELEHLYNLENDMLELRSKILDKYKENRDEAEKLNQEVKEEENTHKEIMKDLEERRKKSNEELEEEKRKREAAEKGIKGNGVVPDSGNEDDKTNLPLFLQPAFAEGITKAATGVSQITMAVTSLSSALSVLTDKTKTPKEIITTLIPALAMAIPGIISGITSLGGAFVSLGIGTELAKDATVGFSEALTATPVGWLIPLVAALTAAFFALDAAIETAQERLEREQKALEEQTEKANKAAEAYNTLVSAREKYNNAIKEINDEDKNLSLEETKKLASETNDAIFEALKNTKNWQTIIGELKYDKNGIIEITENQWIALENDQNRIKLLEEQKQLLQEIATLEASGAADEESYNGPRFYSTPGNGVNWDRGMQDESYRSEGTVYGEDLSSKLWSALSENGIGDASIVKYLSEETLNQIFESLEDERDRAINFVKNLTDDELSKFNEELNKFSENVAKAEADKEQWINSVLSNTSDFSSLSEESQNVLREKMREINPEDRESFLQSIYGEGKSVVEALKEVGVETDNLNLKLKEAEESVHNVFNNAKVEDLTHFKGKIKDLQEEISDLSNYIQKNAKDIDGLSDHLEDCKAESDRIAYAIIRFDDAIQDVTDNYDDWSKALKNGNKNSSIMVQTTKALSKAYGNLLDIDGSNLSQDFLEDTENLELMKQAIEGNEDAYNRLLNAASINFLENILGYSEAEAQNAVNAITSAMDTIEEALGRPIEAGENINFEGINDRAYQAQLQLEAQLNSMLAMIGNNVDLANDLVSRFGYNADFTEVTTDIPSTTEVTEITPTEKEGPTITIPHIMPDPEGLGLTSESIPVPTQGVGIETKNKTETALSEQTVTALQITPGSLHKAVGGDIKFHNANHGSGSTPKSSKGSCFASGTLVTTNHNYKNIEDIKVGDIVLSYNEKTKKNEYSKVLQTMIHNVYEKIYDLFVKDDKLKVTGNHRFLVIHNNEQKWIEAADLQVGDLVLFADGTLHQISKIKTQTRFITVYNFEVSNTHNYYVGENQILAHNKGGGGKKGSERKPKEPVKYEKKEDRYHDLKEQLEDVRLQYDKVNKAKERAFGKSKLKYLDLEIKELQKEDKLLKDYVKEAEKYYQIDRSKVEDLNIGAKFDKNGALINYEEVLSHIEDDMVKATDEYNKAIAAWNAGGSDEDFEKAEKAKKNAEELQKTRMDALKKLEDTYNTWQDKVWEEIQKRWEIYDAKLEKVTLNTEIELEFNEDDLKLLQFIFDHMGDSADTAVDKIANLNEQMKEYDDNIKHIRSGLQGIFANHGIKIDLNNMNPDEIAQQLVTAMDDDTFASELTDKEAKTIRDYISQLMDNTKNLEESFDKVFETVKEGYDQWNERLQDQMGEYARLNKIVSSYKDLVSLTGKDAFGLSYDELNKWNQELVHVAQNQAESAEKIWKDNEKLYQNAVAMYNTAETEEEKKKWKEIMDQRKKTTDEAHQDYLDKVNEWQQAVQTAFEEALDYAKDKYEKSFGQYNFNFIEDEYERLADLDKLYLKPYEKYHDLQKSLKELGKSITDTTNPTVLNKMLTLQDEINDKMASGVQMSSYETGIIERRVALLQAEADLQNAKNAKGAVRMTRDNEGNFSYTYTADQDAIDEAQENLSEKFYELLKFERDSLDEIQDRILEETRKYQEIMDELARTYGEDSAEYMYYAKIVTDDHVQKMKFLESQSGILYGEMGRLRDDDWKNYERILGLKLADTKDFLTAERQTLLGSLFGERGIFPTIKASEEQYLSELKTSVEQYGIQTQQVVNNVTTHMNQDIKNVGTTSDETRGKVHDLGEEMKKAMIAADEAAKGIAQTWAEHMKKVRDDTTSTAGNLNELLKKLNSITTAQKAIADGYTAIKNNANAAAAAMQNAASSGGGGGSGGGTGGGGTSGGGPGGGGSPNGNTTHTYSVYDPRGKNIGTAVKNNDDEGRKYFSDTIKAAGYYTGYYKLYRDGKFISGKEVGNNSQRNNNSGNWKLGMATGGYTGDWGDDSGKIAILHRKEIVLNKEDTSNFLDAVGIVRSIKDFIDMGARNLSNVFNYNVMAGAGTTDLQQQVHIDASFPNVQSHNEIELALNNLINSATQYVNRK